jgi:hypothetical protein
MRSNARFRFALLAPLVGALLAFLAPAAAQAAGEVPVIEKLVATNCNTAGEKCGEELIEKGPSGEEFFEPKAKVTVGEAETEGFTEAGGRVPFGITDFKVLTLPEFEGKPAKYSTGTVVPTLRVTHIRTDVATGLATNPFAVERCSLAEFGKELVPGSGFFTAPGAECTKSKIGQNDVTAYAGNPKEGGAGDLSLSGIAYDLVPGESEKMANGSRLSSLYGVALELPIPLTGALLAKGFKEAEAKGAKQGENGFPTLIEQEGLEKLQYFAHTLIKGNVEWGKEARGTNAGDYHDYFEIEVSPELPLIRSRLTFEGTLGKGDKIGEGDFITNATSCPGDNTTSLKVTDLEGKEAPAKTFTTPIGLSGCGSLLFEPSYLLASGSTLSDQPNEITATVAEPNVPTARAQSQVKTGTITLPEGMTLNPSAAHGLEACTVAQARIHSEVFGSGCPAASEIGTVSLDVPTLPDGSLTGSVYLGGPVTGSETGPITGPPYIVYVVANSEKYGVSVRLKGEVIPNAVTGQVTTIFKENPEQPFTNLSIHFNRGVLTSIANPLICGEPTGTASFVPVANPTTSLEKSYPVSVTGCAASLPFSLTQSTQNQAPGTAGAATSYTLNIERADGQQYLSQIQTTLPEGLVGLIPTVTQCGEAEANAGTCPAASKIGVVGVEAGSGPTPYAFSGSVYLTGPYNGAPFGLSIVVPAVAGPFNLGNVVTRGTLTVNQYTARVTATSTMPRVVGGIPLRLKHVVVNINKQGFLINPTNCSVLNTESILSGFTAPALAAGVTQNLSSPFQVNACGGLAFKPSFKAKTSAKTSKANGASLETTLNIGSGQTNFKSVMVQLPKQLPSRLTTLQKACPESVFATNPYKCPSGSFVGGARANTPTLPGKLQGPAILVSHAGLAFPDLDLVMEANGVKVILVGNTKISKGVTTTTFASTPDVPVSSITVNLPIGGHSALTANGSLCINPLTMPTTMIGQNGFKVTQKTNITVASCPVRIAGKKVVGNTAYITVQTYSAGRISGSGSNLKTVYRHLGKAEKTATLKVPLSNGGLRKGRPLKVKLRVGFVPKTKSIGNSASTTTVVFG